MNIKELEVVGFIHPKWPIQESLALIDPKQNFRSYGAVLSAPPSCSSEYGYPRLLNTLSGRRTAISRMLDGIVAFINFCGVSEAKSFLADCADIAEDVETVFNHGRFVCYDGTEEYIPREIVALTHRAIKYSFETLQLIEKKLATNKPILSSLLDVWLVKESLKGSPLIQLAIPWSELGQTFLNELNHEKNGTTIYSYLSEDLKKSAVCAKNVLTMGSVHGLLKRLSDVDTTKTGSTVLRREAINSIRKYVDQKFLDDITRIQKQPTKTTLRFLFNRMLILDAFVNICQKDFIGAQFDDARLVGLLSICTRNNKKQDTAENSQRSLVTLDHFKFRFGLKPSCLLYSLLCNPASKESVYGRYNSGLLTSNRFTMWAVTSVTPEELDRRLQKANDEKDQRYKKMKNDLKLEIKSKDTRIAALEKTKKTMSHDIDMYHGLDERFGKSNNKTPPITSTRSAGSLEISQDDLQSVVASVF